MITISDYNETIITERRALVLIVIVRKYDVPDLHSATIPII